MRYPRRGQSIFLTLWLAWAYPRAWAIDSAVTGNWSVGSTWVGGVVPGPGTTVNIVYPHVVTVDITTAAASTTTVNGTLAFSRVSHSSLTLVGGSLVVAPGGHLDMGTESSVIPSGVNAHLVLATGAVAGHFGLVVQNGGDFTARGATKTPTSAVLASDDLQTSESFLTLAESPAALDWKLGDVITIGPTQGSGPSTTEERRIIGIAGSVITVDSNFAQVHYGTGTIRVANLTRNVLVRSSGTVVSGPGANSAYLRNLAQNTTSFDLRYGEFAYLGANEASKYGITFDGSGVRGSISSSTVRNGYFGVYVNSAANNAFKGNLIYAHGAAGIYLDAVPGGALISNHLYSNLGDGARLKDSLIITVDSNTAYSNSGNGLRLDATGNNVLRLNRAYSNGQSGFLLTDNSINNVWTTNGVYANGRNGFELLNSNNNLFLYNDISSNTIDGISAGNSRNCGLSGNQVNGNANAGINLFSNSHFNTLLFNDVHSNAAAGIFSYDSSNHIFAHNRVHANGGPAVSLVLSNNVVLANEYIYANAGIGLYVDISVNGAFVEGALGYDDAGASRPNGTAELATVPPANIILRNTRVNPSVGISTAGFSQAGAHLFSYNQDFDTGTVRFWGNVAIAGSTRTFDYFADLLPSGYTVPKQIIGVGDAASVVSTNDQNAVTQYISITYQGGSGPWIVQGSSTGLMGSFNAPISNQPFPAAAPQFHLSFVQGAPFEGSAIDFMLLGASKDANRQKRLLFGPSAAGFNGGKSKLVVEPTGGIVFKGTNTAHTLVDRLSVSSTYYSFVSSGAFTAHFSSFSNMDSGGIQLSGDKGISIATSTFDFMGVAAATNAYITTRGLTSSATFYNVTFGLSRSTAGAAFAYNVQVGPSDAGPAWVLRNFGGAFGGEDFDYDPNDRVAWRLDSFPRVVSIAPAHEAIGVSRSTAVTVTFDKLVTSASFITAFRLAKIRDNLANPVSVSIPSTTVTPLTNSLSFTFTPPGLDGNSRYSVTVTTDARSPVGDPLEAEFRSTFTTVMDRSVKNIVSGQGLACDITVPAGALNADGYVRASSTDISPNIAAATQRLQQNTGDPYRSPISGSLLDLKAFDTLGNSQSNFAQPIELCSLYADLDGNGVVDGTNPPVRASSLSWWFLDEANKMWVRLPSSTVDKSARRVDVRTPHFTTFALIGQSDADLSDAYVYPVPFRPARGHAKVTFTGLGQNTRIRIFTITGKLVRELRSDSVAGQLDWDVRNSEGSPAASGVYVYLLEDGKNRATGKLIIIR